MIHKVHFDGTGGIAEENKFLRKKYFKYTQKCLKNDVPIMKYPEWLKKNKNKFIY